MMGKSHKMGETRKSKFLKMVKKSLKIRKLRINHIKWEKSQNQNFLKSPKIVKKSFKIARIR